VRNKFVGLFAKQKFSTKIFETKIFSKVFENKNRFNYCHEKSQQLSSKFISLKWCQTSYKTQWPHRLNTYCCIRDSFINCKFRLCLRVLWMFPSSVSRKLKVFAKLDLTHLADIVHKYFVSFTQQWKLNLVNLS